MPSRSVLNTRALRSHKGARHASSVGLLLIIERPDPEPAHNRRSACLKAQKVEVHVQTTCYFLALLRDICIPRLSGGILRFAAKNLPGLI
jgi:hypothetical protein